MSTQAADELVPARSTRDEAGLFSRPLAWLLAARVLAVATALIARVSLPKGGPLTDDPYIVVAFAFGFAHYAASYVYSTRQMRQVAGSMRGLASMTIVLAAIAYLFVYTSATEFSYATYTILVYYFGVHHVFNDVYLTRGAMAPGQGRGRFTASSVVFNAALYLAVLVQDVHLPREILLPLLGLAGIWYAVELRRLSGSYTPRELLQICSPEVFTLALTSLTLASVLPIRFLDFVLYHFVFWAIHPLIRVQRGGQRAVARYLLVNAGLLALALGLSPLGFFSYELNGSAYQVAFFLLSYLHITTAFALSDQHPAWIVRMFRSA